MAHPRSSCLAREMQSVMQHREPGHRGSPPFSTQRGAQPALFKGLRSLVKVSGVLQFLQHGLPSACRDRQSGEISAASQDHLEFSSPNSPPRSFANRLLEFALIRADIYPMSRCLLGSAFLSEETGLISVLKPKCH